MNILPFDVRRYLYKQWSEKNFFAYILIDKLDSSLAWSENISTLYGISLVQNQPADEQLLFLQGIYPYQGNQPLILEEVNFSTNKAADIHIVPSRYNLCILLFDVTKTVKLHQDLQQKRNELKLLYEQELHSMRSLKKSYEELKRQKELADSANRSKSELLEHMTRDLKSPLNGILGFAQLLEMLEKPLTGYAQEYVQEIKNSGNHLLTLINDLRDVFESESKKTQINPETLSVSVVLKDSIDAIKSTAEKNNIEFINRLDNNLLLTSVDPIYFRHIIMSLLANAIQYNRENGCIIISTYVTENNSVHINFKDTGIGITSEYLPDLFQTGKSQTVENSATKNATSLRTCKQLTEAMQGTIGVYSDVGIGSLFWLEFPLANKETLAKIKPQYQRQTILYIENNQTYIFLMDCFLEQYRGCSLLNATNGADTFELINNQSVSVILLDTDTFSSDYLDIFQALQRHEKSKNIPVIALFNSNTDLSKIKTALNSGFYDYMIKPFDFNLAMELFDRLERLSKSQPVLPVVY